MSNSIGERLKEERLRLGLNQQKMGEIGGVKVFAQSNYENEKRIPGGDYFAAVAKVGVDILYILTGLRASQPDTPNHLAPIRMYDIEASAGHGALVLDESQSHPFSVEQDLLLTQGIEPKNCAIISVRGDSMQPTLENGDLVIVDRSKTKPDGMFLVRLHDTLLVKRVQREGGGAYVLGSDNGHYREILIPPTEANSLTIIGKCMLKIGSLC